MKNYIFRTTATMKEYNNKNGGLIQTLSAKLESQRKQQPPPLSNTGNRWRKNIIFPFPTMQLKIKILCI